MARFIFFPHKIFARLWGADWPSPWKVNFRDGIYVYFQISYWECRVLQSKPVGTFSNLVRMSLHKVVATGADQLILFKLGGQILPNTLLPTPRVSKSTICISAVHGCYRAAETDKEVGIRPISRGPYQFLSDTLTLFQSEVSWFVPTKTFDYLAALWLIYSLNKIGLMYLLIVNWEKSPLVPICSVGPADLYS